MDKIKPYSRRSFWLILMFMVLLAGALSAATFYGKTHISQDMSHLVTPDITPPDLMVRVNQLHDTYAIYLISLSAGLLILFGIILWMVLRRVARGVLANAVHAAPKSNDTKTSDKNKDEKQQLENQRLFLHLLVVLQREGRLLDFFQEDLDMYEDEQIGAAVRNIHDSCKKIINKNLAMEPIITGGEGEEVEVKTGFDPDAIKLTGRVTGEPPFTGIIRHKGWRAQKLELPDLSAAKDPGIISPAEVEIE
jgi:uncharacterized membrane protein YhaH (DUF805 family)